MSGLRRAILIGFAALCLGAAAAVPTASASSPLRWRGIVEGAYGRPWTHIERMDVLRWMAAHDYNAYVHAPKDDLYQRTNWRDPYPGADQAEFDREIRFARRHGIEWVPNLSPAMPLIPTLAVPAGIPSRDLCFSCPGDLEATVAKLQPFLDAGVRTVMISFDDVTKLSTHPEDLAAYGLGDRAFGEANGEFLTNLLARLREIDPRMRLLTVGADYSGPGGTDYLDGLRSTLAPGIEVMWTGTSVPSEQWAPADARAYGESIGRTPVVWENWTNNDTAGNVITGLGAARIFLGPYIRDPADAGAVRGFFFNPANEAYLNFLPLATAADWMRDPRHYRPRRSWLAAVAELAGGGAGAARRRESLRAWAETSWSNKLDREREAPTFTGYAEQLLSAYAGGGWVEPYGRLMHELALVRAAPERLGALPQQGFAAQAGEFLAAARAMATTGAAAASLLAAERPSLSARRVRGGFSGRVLPPDSGRATALRSSLSALTLQGLLETEFTYGWRLPVAFEIPPYAVPRNVMDEFVAGVRNEDSRWQAVAPQAASSVALTLNGAGVAVDESGHFRLPASACGKNLLATDGAGGKTGFVLPDC